MRRRRHFGFQTAHHPGECNRPGFIGDNEVLRCQRPLVVVQRDEDFAGARSESRTAPGNPDITVEEAHAILGLAPGADAEAIRAAHRRLMKQLHPDHGGTDYLATKINRARDVLLNR